MLFPILRAAALFLLGADALVEMRVEPFGLEAGTEVPFYISFTTGNVPGYGLDEVDDGSARMLVALHLSNVGLGRNNDCKKVLEAPGLPPLRRCIRGPDGIFALELRGGLWNSTRYDLLVLGVLPEVGVSIRQMTIRILKPGSYVDFSNLLGFEEGTVDIAPQFTTLYSTGKFVTGLELVKTRSSTSSQYYPRQGMMNHQYTLKVTGSSVPFGQGDQLRIVSSPFMYEDEGLSFGGACDGFDTSSFANPLEGCSCEVTSIPAGEVRVGYNAFVLTFGISATLSTVPRYFTIALNTPKHMGSMGHWYIASKDSTIHDTYTKVLQAKKPFFIVPAMVVIPTMSAPARPTYGAEQRLLLTIRPLLNLLGDSQAPPSVTIRSPAFQTITHCYNRAPSPEIVVIGQERFDAHCVLKFHDNQNLYVHQPILASIDVTNPSFPMDVDNWVVTVESGDGTMTVSETALGWPVYASLTHAYVVPETMEYAMMNSLQIFFRPSATTPPEPRAVVEAPAGFRFGDICDFEVIAGFPREGVQCSLPLSQGGRDDLFSLRMPLMTIFEAGHSYAAKIFPIRNPYPGSHVAPLDAISWHINLIAADGSTVLETDWDAPMGPHLRSFQIFPRAISNIVVEPDSRLPGVKTAVTIRFRASANITSHGERMLITAPYGFKWEVGHLVEVTAGSQKVRVASFPYNEAYPPVVPPHNQIEITLIDPHIFAGENLTVTGTLRNALIDATLNADVQSANVWTLEMFEPAAGFLKYEHRHQAGVIPGFSLQAITGGSVSAWLPIARRGQTAVGVTFRLGTTLHLLGVSGRSTSRGLEIRAPEGFFFPEDCASNRISPMHLTVAGFFTFRPGAIEGCRGASADSQAGNVARVLLSGGVEVPRDRLYAILLEAIIPNTLPEDNTWAITSFTGPVELETQAAIEGFKLTTEFLSALYHPGMADTGENLRVGASDNQVIFSIQPASPVLVGGQLRITAPYRFQFGLRCEQSVFSAKAILNSVSPGGEADPEIDANFLASGGSGIWSDLPPLSSCLGTWNTAQLTFQDTLDVAVHYAFRIAIANPSLPHPWDWPIAQNIWRIETFDPLLAPLNSAEVQAFFLWAFAHAHISPLSSGAGELALVTLELQPSLTVPPSGSLHISAPEGWELPVPCGFQPNTHAQGFRPLPETMSCGRGIGNALRLELDATSYLAAGERYRFRVAVQHPKNPTAFQVIVKAATSSTPSSSSGTVSRKTLLPDDKVLYVDLEGERWELATSETDRELGESFLERNPGVEGYLVYWSLEKFVLRPESRLAQHRTTVFFAFALPEDLAVFRVARTTDVEMSWLVIDLPLFVSVPLGESSELEPMAETGIWNLCEAFVPINPEPIDFPVGEDSCLASAKERHVWLLLNRNLKTGLEYSFKLGMLHPVLTSEKQRQLEMANVWQLRLVRTEEKVSTTFASRAAPGYRVVPLLPDCSIRSDTWPLSVQAETLVSVAFQTVSQLVGDADMSLADRLHIVPPVSMTAPHTENHLQGGGNVTHGGNRTGAIMCQLWVAGTLRPAEEYTCIFLGALTVYLHAVIEEGADVQVDFNLYSGTSPLLDSNAAENVWSVRSLDAAGDVIDTSMDTVGFTVFASLEDVAVVPKDTLAMSYTNHATFRFRTPQEGAEGSSQILVVAPEGFVLYPSTFRPSQLPGNEKDSEMQPHARQGPSAGVALITLPRSLEASTEYAFLLTIGNPSVSPPENMWMLEVRDGLNRSLCIHSQVPGFLVHSSFNTSMVYGQLDEPLAENYVHVTISVSERLLADSMHARSTCVPSPWEPLCSPRKGVRSVLVITAPEGFSFLPTCGFWVLSRVGSRHRGLPPGSLCRSERARANVAKVELALSLEPMVLYEFTLQLRNALAVPLRNFWSIEALQDGVLRERNMRVRGFPLRQFRSAGLVPSTTLAGAVDNTLTLRLRSERPVTRASSFLVVAPAGFVLEPESVSGSFVNPLLAYLPEKGDGSAIRVELSRHDFVPPNVYFFISVRARNPMKTPEPNFWHLYLQSQFREHIDLKKFMMGFVVGQQMHYCQVYPNVVPWERGTPNDVSIFFVTQSPVFTRHHAIERLGDQHVDAENEAAYSTGEVSEDASWEIVLVAPPGFIFPTENQYSERCSSFMRWGGKDSYDQLPDLQSTPVSCTVHNARSIRLSVPLTIVNETRYSFRINVTTAPRREDIALQAPWKLSILENGDILHIGSSPSPLLDTAYVPEWMWVPGRVPGSSASGPSV